MFLYYNYKLHQRKKGLVQNVSYWILSIKIRLLQSNKWNHIQTSFLHNLTIFNCYKKYPFNWLIIYNKSVLSF